MADGDCETLSKACREKNWDELEIDGKLERMRRIVKTNNIFARNVGRKVDKLRDHIHDPNGKMFIPLKSGLEESDRSYRNEDYF